jgi:hypothetical protein
MALPGRDQTFAYENCREMLNKLEREIERYCAVAGVVEVLEGEKLLRHVDRSVCASSRWTLRAVNFMR